MPCNDLATLKSGHVGAVGAAAAFAFLADLAGGAEPALDPMLSMFAAQQAEAEVVVPTLEEVCCFTILADNKTKINVETNTGSPPPAGSK